MSQDSGGQQRPKRTPNPLQSGPVLSIQCGRASCHGLRAGDGPVAPDLPSNISDSKVRKETRRRPKGMPAYLKSAADDEAVASIIAFLRG